MAMTSNVVRGDKGQILKVNGRKAPPALASLYVPPAWTGLQVDPDSTTLLATGFDAAGRKQYLYSREHVESAKSGKFERVKFLLAEWEDVRTQIESDINCGSGKSLSKAEREAAFVAYLIYETGMRPGSTSDTKAQVQAFGATTIQLRHVKPCARGVRLQFVGKKGVSQNVLVTNPYLVDLLLARKRATTKYTTRVFKVSPTTLNSYIAGLGSGEYTAKDFRTARGTSLALQLLGSRKRLPKAKAARKRLVNAALDKVAKTLGNTRAVSRASYVDPAILERFFTV